MHCRVTNIGSKELSIIRVRGGTEASEGFETRSPGPRMMAPNSTIVITLSPLNRIIVGRTLRMAFDYSVVGLEADERVVRTKFILPANVVSGTRIDPVEASDEKSDWDENAKRADLLTKLDIPEGALLLTMPDHRPDGSWNNVHVSRGNKDLVIDFSNKIVSGSPVTFATRAWQRPRAVGSCASCRSGCRRIAGISGRFAAVTRALGGRFARRPSDGIQG